VRKLFDWAPTPPNRKYDRDERRWLELGIDPDWNPADILEALEALRQKVEREEEEETKSLQDEGIIDDESTPVPDR
jgi:hypothetical protein